MSLTGDKCVTRCEENEISNGKRCVCDPDSILHEDKTYCLLDSDCTRTFSDDGVLVCLSAKTCTGDFKL